MAHLPQAGPRPAGGRGARPDRLGVKDADGLSNVMHVLAWKSAPRLIGFPGNPLRAPELPYGPDGSP